jgi:hypothetical protein
MPSLHDDERRYCRHPDAVTECVGSDLLLVQLAQGTTFRLNYTGRAIWELAVSGCTMGEIADQLHERYGLPAEQLLQDSDALLEELAQCGLLVGRTEAT